ncbi:MAG: phospho-N-acetylmuramoyl-pentapeptide-transferase [Gemmatimonadetes bacterium]|nr:phospho-N-acetylmuramoyl-pentapeptide-transferase [Gemmatimonadota bacterium]
MLYHLLPQFSDVHIVFNLFRYITFRAAGAMVTSLVLAFILGPITIRWLTRLRVGQVVRQEGPESHLHKAGTPTMGGALIVMATVLSTLLWAELTNWYTVLALVTFVWMGALGFFDDYLKVVRGRTEGLVARYKMAGTLGFGILLGLFLVLTPLSRIPANWTSLPFFADWHATFWLPVYVVFVSLVVSGTSNAVNLTDGLDGLAAGLCAIAAGTFGVFAYLIGRVDTSAYLGLFYLPGSEELSIFAMAIAGAAMGFLWFNAHPAEVFMGDTGSLAMGGAIGVMAILLKAEFLLLIVGGVFVIEALSVILQTGYFRYTARRYGMGRRIFRMAPIHHHFERLGWAESKVVIRFWILGILFAMIGFGSLKIR